MSEVFIPAIKPSLYKNLNMLICASKCIKNILDNGEIFMNFFYKVTVSTPFQINIKAPKVSKHETIASLEVSIIDPTRWVNPI
jgi:hypothetical protein